MIPDLSVTLYLYISRCPRNFGHVKRAAIHGDVRFNQNPVLEVMSSLPGDSQVLLERFNDTGEISGRRNAIKVNPTNRI